MKKIKALINAFDSYQQGHRWLGFPLAVVKKFNDDNAGNLAAVMAWNAMLAIFPLLLVLVTVLGIALHGNPHLQTKILNSALGEFPVIGTSLHQNINALNKVGFALIVGIIGSFLGARGVANAAQTAFNSVWEVPYERRPGFPMNALRSLGIIVVLGLGIIATTTLAGFGGGTGTLGAGVRIAAIAIALVLNGLIFLVAYRLAVAKEVGWRDLWLGAALTAIIWQILQTAGSYIVSHDVKNMTAIYGTFALVLGLMSWLYLQCQLTLYAAEIDVVRARGLWPRTFLGSGRTPVDEDALESYANVEERRSDQNVDVTFDGAPTDPPSAETSEPALAAHSDASRPRARELVLRITRSAAGQAARRRLTSRKTRTR
jgi:membrane protein